VGIEVIQELWTSSPDRAENASCLIDEAIPMASRPAWAADLLEAACTRLQKVPAPVRRVIAIGRSPRRWWWNRWRGAHAAFNAVRDLTLAEDASGAHGQEHLAVLVVAESAAKVIYNASGVTDYDQPAPFDDDCGVRLVVSLWHLVRACESPLFAQQVWVILESWLRRGITPAEPTASADAGRDPGSS
jgi:hypothetical protein